MRDIFSWIEEKGRWTGLLGMIAGIVILFLGYLDYRATGSYYVFVAIIGFSFLGIGIINTIIGKAGNHDSRPTKTSKRRARKVHEKMEAKRRRCRAEVENLRRELVKYSFPYTLCLKNKTVVEKGAIEDLSSMEKDPCRDCNLTLDHIEICNDEDLRLALLGLEG